MRTFEKLSLFVSSDFRCSEGCGGHMRETGRAAKAKALRQAPGARKRRYSVESAVCEQ